MLMFYFIVISLHHFLFNLFPQSVLLLKLFLSFFQPSRGEDGELTGEVSLLMLVRILIRKTNTVSLLRFMHETHVL